MVNVRSEKVCAVSDESGSLYTVTADDGISYVPGGEKRINLARHQENRGSESRSCVSWTRTE